MFPQHRTPSQPQSAPRTSGQHRYRAAFLAGSSIASLIAAALMVLGVAGDPVSTASGADTASADTVAELPSNSDTVFGAARPASDARHSAPSIELGLRFSAQVDGAVAGLRVYRPEGRTAGQTASLWTDSGTRLAGPTIPTSTSAGWLYVALGTPVRVERDTVYVASYHTDGGYVADANYFSTGARPRGLVRPAMTGGEVDRHNGVYRFAGNIAFPNQSFRSTNYWVDVAFVTAVRPPTATTPPSTPPTTTFTPTPTPSWTCLVTCPPCPNTCNPTTPTTSTPTVTSPPPTPTATSRPGRSLPPFAQP